jgi:hypothetical protein
MSATKLAVYFMVILCIITFVFGLIGLIIGQYIYVLTFCTYIIAVIALVFSVAISMDENNINGIEKRLECFYKPVAQIIENQDKINDRFDEITTQLQKIRRYDHLAKDETTIGLFRNLTGTLVTVSTAPSITKKKDMKTLLGRVQKDIIDDEKYLNELYVPLSRKSLIYKFMNLIHIK